MGTRKLVFCPQNAKYVSGEILKHHIRAASTGRPYPLLTILLMLDVAKL
jgi:hypothetical protein